MRSRPMTQVAHGSEANLKGPQMGRAIGGGGKALEGHGELGDESWHTPTHDPQG